MHGFSEHQLLGAFLAIAVVLLAARGMAEVSRRLGQPEVLGELLGGFLIGPSVLGALFPHAFSALFLNPSVSLALQLLSWIGAILLLMIAGMEADLAILKQKAVPGLLAAAGAMGAAIGVGTEIGVKFFHQDPTGAFFLGLVLSVTAVSVVAKLLIEREALRRDYAQVMLAAGIASEVVVWPLISVVSSVQHKANPFAAGLRATGLAIVFFAFMFTLGRRFTFWAMRRVADAVTVPSGELSLVLILLCISAAATTLMGLHPLLGAFVFGVLLSKAPRATPALKERIGALTIALFAPIFFGLAGMRVNLFHLRGLQSIEGILILLVVAGVAKVLLGTLGAFAGKLPPWEAATVGVGLNLKGGTDVVIAIVGTELLLLSSDLYTAYAVVAILTVVISPPILRWMAAKTRPGEAELKRLNREEARKLAYFADCERVLLPMIPDLLPAHSAMLAAAMAAGKHAENELFDITEMSFAQDDFAQDNSLTRAATPDALVQASSTLSHASDFSHVALDRISSEAEDRPAAIQAAAAGQHLLLLGTSEVTGDVALSFGLVQDRLLRECATDILLTVFAGATPPLIKRILVPVNGLAHSLAAADLAGYIAKGSGAEVVLLAVVSPRPGSVFWKERRHRDLRKAGYATTGEAKARLARLEIQLTEKVVLAEDVGGATLAELAESADSKQGPYDMLLLGSVKRFSEGGVSLGRTVETLLGAAQLPRAVLISGANGAPAAASA